MRVGVDDAVASFVAAAGGRGRTVIAGRRAVVLQPTSVLVLLVALVVGVGCGSRASTQSAGVRISATGSVTSSDAAAAIPSRPRMGVFGDSTALLTALGLGQVDEAEHLAQPTGAGDIQLGCPLARVHEALRANAPLAIPARCDWTQRWPSEVRAAHLQLVVVQFGPWDTEPQKMPGDSAYRVPGDPVYDAWLLKEMTAAVDALSSGGAEVVWLTSPAVGDQARRSRHPDLEDLVQPKRMAAFNSLIERLPGLRPGKVQVVDLARWMAGRMDDTGLRPDGVHFTEGAAREVSSEYLAAAVMSAFRSAWKAAHPG
jgi:hypothetical protein